MRYKSLNVINVLLIFHLQDDASGDNFCYRWKDTRCGRSGTGDGAARLVHRNRRDRCILLSARHNAADIPGHREKESI